MRLAQPALAATPSHRDPPRDVASPLRRLEHSRSGAGTPWRAASSSRSWPRARQRGADDVRRARESLRGAFDDLQTDIDEAHKTWPPNATLRAPSTAGTTAVLCIIRDVGDLIDVAHVGDSRAVVGRGPPDDVSDGEPCCRAVNLTTDHKCHDIDERRRIEAGGGRVYIYGGARGPVDSRVGLPRLKADCAIQMKRQKVSGEIVDLPHHLAARKCWAGRAERGPAGSEVARDGREAV